MQQQPSSTDGSATDELRSDVKELGTKAASRVHSEVDSRKGAAVSQAQSVSSAIARTGDSLDDSAPQWLKSAFLQGAQKIQQFADTIEQKDSREILDDVQSFARERPALFLGACAAAGFAAARILKAGGEQQSSEQFTRKDSFGQAGGYEQGQPGDQSQPWGDGEQRLGESLREGPEASGDPLVGSSGNSRGEFV
jgi:ElaB/YqjD/DUF883 family membrane-anchored ribosome-binding protein